MTTTVDPLAAFVGTGDQYRYVTSQVWHDGQFRLATDTRIAAMMPSDEPATVLDGERQFPPVAKFVTEVFAKTGDWTSVPKLPKPTGSPCVACKGKGAFTKCRECDGDGVVICLTCDNEEDCRRCKSEGRLAQSGGDIRCDACLGTGERECEDKFNLFGRNFATKYLRKIAALPDVEIAISTSKPGVLAFRSGEIRGVLMGLND